MSLTIDNNDPGLKKTKPNGQQEAYLILSEEERSKGFIRPVRTSYVHVGSKKAYKGLHRILESSEQEVDGKKYYAVMTVITDDSGKFIGGTYVTKEEFDAWEKGERVGGCGGLTMMARQIAETYAKDPKFYSATFCCDCGKHLPVNEFFWEGTEEKVGS